MQTVRGLSEPHTPTSTRSFTFHQHNPGPTALPGSGGTRRYVSKLHLPENKSEVCSADNNARLCRSQACARAGLGGEPMIPWREAAPWCCADSGHSASASCSAQCPCCSNLSGHPTYSHGSHRYKKEILSLPAALRERSALGWV